MRVCVDMDTEAFAYYVDSVLECCIGGDVKGLKKLAVLWNGGHRPELNIDDALIFAADAGHVNILKCLYKDFGLSYRNASARDNLAIQLASKNGHVEVLEVLYSLYRLRKLDAQSNNNFALRTACMHNQVEIMECLADLYELDYDDAKVDCAFCLRLGVECGNDKVLECLYEVYGLDEDDAVDVITPEMLVIADEKGYSKSLKILRNLYGVNVV